MLFFCWLTVFSKPPLMPAHVFRVLESRIYVVEHKHMHDPKHAHNTQALASTYYTTYMVYSSIEYISIELNLSCLPPRNWYAKWRRRVRSYSLLFGFQSVGTHWNRTRFICQQLPLGCRVVVQTPPRDSRRVSHVVCGSVQWAAHNTLTGLYTHSDSTGMLVGSASWNNSRCIGGYFRNWQRTTIKVSTVNITTWYHSKHYTTCTARNCVSVFACVCMYVYIDYRITLKAFWIILCERMIERASILHYCTTVDCPNDMDHKQ